MNKKKEIRIEGTLLRAYYNRQKDCIWLAIKAD